MFWFVVDILMLRRLGLGRPFRYALLLLLFGLVIAGSIYAFVVFHALDERRHVPHVYTPSTR
jgi:hypothetical protein